MKAQPGIGLYRITNNFDPYFITHEKEENPNGTRTRDTKMTSAPGQLGRRIALSSTEEEEKGLRSHTPVLTGI
ncbi:hypothetical protein IMZ48_40975 [Candidatus Bathyarchaeota archaeon]|nr:hypothetical protein [Candidatus Bathyarchaeota archaeon]